MSMHHKPGTWAKKMAEKLADLDWPTYHQGEYGQVLKRHRMQASRFWKKKGRAAVGQLVPTLLRRASDERVLRSAWAYLESNGGQSPGPDGLRYEDCPDYLVWQVCRNLRDDIRSGEYEPREESVLWISKGPGRGKRPLALQSIIDRVVQRAYLSVSQPVLDPLFDARSFGYRPGPGRSHLHALATAERIAIKEERWFWVSADVKDAFGSVPLNRLLDIVKKYLPDEKLAAFLKQVLSGSTVDGLRQGGCLSPFLLNLYMHHVLDLKWRKQSPAIPLVRYADDILMLCGSMEEAANAYARLKALLTPAGLLLKESQAEAVSDLSAGGATRYMGFTAIKDGDEVRFKLAGRAWDRLSESLAAAVKADGGKTGKAAFHGWVAAQGPCYESLDIQHAQNRIANIGHKAGFAKAPTTEQVESLWQRAYARWKKIRKAVKKAKSL